MPKEETPFELRPGPAKTRDPERSQRMLGLVLWLTLALTLWKIAAR